MTELPHPQPVHREAMDGRGGNDRLRDVDVQADLFLDSDATIVAVSEVIAPLSTVDPWNHDSRDHVDEVLDEVRQALHPYTPVPPRLRLSEAARVRLTEALQGETARARAQWGDFARAIALAPATAQLIDKREVGVWAAVTDRGEALLLTDSLLVEMDLASPLLGGIVPFIARPTVLVGRGVQSFWVECWLSPAERFERSRWTPPVEEGVRDVWDSADWPWSPERDGVQSELGPLMDTPGLLDCDPMTPEQRTIADAVFGTIRFGRTLDAALPETLQHPVGLLAAQEATLPVGMSGLLPAPEALVCYVRSAMPSWPK